MYHHPDHPLSTISGGQGGGCRYYSYDFRRRPNKGSMEEVDQINNKSGAGTKVGSKSRKAQVLTERDFEALLWISKHGLMTIEQLYRAVWKRSGQTQIRYTYDRVKFLKESNFIYEVTTPFSKKSYFELTKQGAQIASQRTAQGIIPTAKIPQSEIMHADTLTELKLSVLENGRAKSWVTDRELYLDEAFPKERFSSKAAFPDALWVTQSGIKVAVEYEHWRASVSDK